MNKTELFASAIVLMSEDINKTIDFYKNQLGFEVIKNFEHEEKFAACYRDNVEIVVVQIKKGKVISNTKRYGAGFDAYLVPEDVNAFYNEIKDKEVKIIEKPVLKSYGSIEMKIEDIDGRIIGIGRVEDQEVFFNKNN